MYRYTLTRKFSNPDGRGQVAFVMLNPSTADAFTDDATIRRCKTFAVREGFASMLVVNLFAVRATNPKDLRTFYERRDPRPNAGELAAWNLAFSESRMVIAAWGSQAGFVQRLIVSRVAHLIEIANKHDTCMFALGITRDGWPRHPLYLPGDAPLRGWICPDLAL